jgi:hypothetical protein
VGRRHAPIDFPEPLRGEEVDLTHTGNRFDSPTEGFRTCYFATEPIACFGETLSRFRPNPLLADAAAEEGLMGIGQVPADWRHSRVLLRAELEPTVTRPALDFLDVEARDSREHLRKPLGRILAYYEVDDLDVSVVRGGDRRITRWIAKWTHEVRDDDGNRLFAGVRYLSRLDSKWECWAIFDDVGVVELERSTITRQHPELRAIARDYEITVH